MTLSWFCLYPDRVRWVRPLLVTFEYGMKYVCPTLASFGVRSPQLRARPLIFSLVVSSLIRCFTYLVYLLCVWNPFSNDPSSCRTCGANPKCMQSTLHAKVPYHHLWAQLFWVAQFKHGRKGTAQVPLHSNMNFPSLFALDAKELGQCPCAQSCDPKHFISDSRA